eukprot:gnl/TRDRNA2_/TRDRNA2_133780_c0_seq2.p1 gnl/TRDRNA2_/TRDRNA2_133780_c0~~gnl/TRDRNA2_/TRDRNA2_133780_c0_seq2.p1  ORF type:complete len:512 (-),score=58.33 gnl/TRDRNA2_/TRDRNA2_133780_c0_seq2:82-1617(-)
MEDEVADDAICAICLESLMAAGKRRRLRCGHVLHDHCVVRMRRFGSSGRCCPLCRSECADLSSVQQLLDDAALCEARGLFAEMATILSEILIVDPSNGAANYHLAAMYAAGHGVEQNALRAVELYEEARKAAYPKAACNLGVMYVKGDGIEQNLGRAIELYQEARLAGDARATCNLGLMHVEGQGVERNSLKALELFNEAHRAGHPEAACHLGVMYEHGIGLAKDPSRAAALYEEARSAGYIRAACNLGMMCIEGRNIKKAVELFEEARRAGHAEAAYNLGVLHEEGLGLEQDLTKAVQLYEEAHKLGYLRATHKLGLMYANGQGVERSCTRAWSLLEEARAQGLTEGLRLCRLSHGVARFRMGVQEVVCRDGAEHPSVSRPAAVLPPTGAERSAVSRPGIGLPPAGREHTVIARPGTGLLHAGRLPLACRAATATPRRKLPDSARGGEYYCPGYDMAQRAVSRGNAGARPTPSNAAGHADARRPATGLRPFSRDCTWTSPRLCGGRWRSV